MSRNLSNSAKTALFAQETEETFIILLTISHEELLVPIRVCNNSEDIISNGETFIAYPFELDLPLQADDRPPTAKLRIDNVHREIVASVRSISSAPDVVMSIIRAAEPDTVEITFPDFKLRNVSYDALLVEGDLTIEHFVDEPYPADVFSPGDFPGIF